MLEYLSAFFGILLSIVLIVWARTPPNVAHKPTQKQTKNATALRKQNHKGKKKPLPDTTGRVRRCRFCSVIVEDEQCAGHLAGKKHKKLAEDANDDQAWVWVERPPPSSSDTPSISTALDCPGVTADAAGDSKGWVVVGLPAKRKASKTKPKPAALDLDALPSVGFKEPSLGCIQSGAKTFDARLERDPATRELEVGTVFLARSAERKLVLAVTSITLYDSFGAAWQALRHRLIPAAWGSPSSAEAAQALYQTLYSRPLSEYDSARVLGVEVRQVVR